MYIIYTLYHIHTLYNMYISTYKHYHIVYIDTSKTVSTMAGEPEFDAVSSIIQGTMVLHHVDPPD